MAHAQRQTPQVRGLRSAIKAGMRSWHEGPNALPRKAIYMPLGLDDSTYSRYLNPEEPDLPGLLLMGQMVNLSHDPAPFRQLLALLGEGYEVSIASEDPVVGVSGLQLLADTAQVDGEFMADLSRKLAAGTITQDEAADLLPKARLHLKNAQRDYDALEGMAKGRRAS